jgi:hypothetical protein
VTKQEGVMMNDDSMSIGVFGCTIKQVFAKAFLVAEKDKWVVETLVITPQILSLMRRATRDEIDEIAQIELRRTGFIGTLFGAGVNIEAKHPVNHFELICTQSESGAGCPVIRKVFKFEMVAFDEEKE